MTNDDFYENGYWDCGHVYDADEYDLDALVAATDVRAAARDAIRAVLDGSDVSQIEAEAREYELDAARAVENWKRGWIARGVEYLVSSVEAYRKELAEACEPDECSVCHGRFTARASDKLAICGACK